MKLGAGVAEPYIVFDGTFSTPRLDHAECVVVADDGALWCGGENGQIFRIDGDQITEVASTGGFTLGLAFDGKGGLFICDSANSCVWRLDTESAALEVFGDSVDGQDLLTPNYPLLLPDGSLLVSDSGRAHEPRAGVVRFSADGGRGQVWHPQPMNFANGLALSADANAIYIAETWASRVLVLDIDKDGEAMGEPRVFADLAGYLPDGLAIDGDGRLYVGCYEPSAILRVLESGTVEVVAHDESAHLLCHPTNLAFRASQLIAANLGRWHLTGIDLD